MKLVMAAAALAVQRLLRHLVLLATEEAANFFVADGVLLRSGKRQGNPMKNRNLGRTIVFLGLAALIGSMAWWAVYYHLVIGALGQNPVLMHPMGCLLWTSDLCEQAKAAAKVANVPAYNPLALWVSIAILVIGLGIVWRSPSPGAVPMTPPGEPKLFIRQLEPFYAWSRDLSWPVVRIAAAGTLVYFGIVKLLTSSVATFATGSMARRGLEPAMLLAYIVWFNETVGACMVALGLFTRFVAASIAIEMFVLTFVALFANGFVYNSGRGGWQFGLLLGALFFAIALRGGGPYSLDRLLRREL
jgi:putative oxidoreductase